MLFAQDVAYKGYHGLARGTSMKLDSWFAVWLVISSSSRAAYPPMPNGIIGVGQAG